MFTLVKKYIKDNFDYDALLELYMQMRFERDLYEQLYNDIIGRKPSKRAK